MTHTDQEATEISSLVGKTIAKISTDPKSSDYHFFDKNGKVFLIVSRDDIYDGQGFFFIDNLDE